MEEDLLIPLIAIFFTELGDKTQICVFLLSTQLKDRRRLLSGILLAFLLVDGFAIILGSLFADFIPVNLLKITSGIIFIVFGLLILLKKDFEKNCKIYSKKNSFISGFLLIFMMEWGDKTQIAAGLFATKYDPFLVLIGTMVSLSLISISAIYIGKIISEKVNSNLVAKIAGLVFIFIGLSFFLL